MVVGLQVDQGREFGEIQRAREEPDDGVARDGDGDCREGCPSESGAYCKEIML